MAGVGNVGGGSTWQAMSTQLHALENANQGKGDKHVRGTAGSTQLYVHGDKAHGIGSRQPKYQEGVGQIKAALDQDFGPGFGDRAFKELGKTKGFFSANPEKGLKLKDIDTLDQIVQNLRAADLQSNPSDLSGLSGHPVQDAHTVLTRNDPALAHVKQAFKDFLAENYEQPTMQFVEAYHALLANPNTSKADVQAFIRDHVDDPGMNIYSNNKDESRARVENLGANPTRDDVMTALDHVVRDVNESFGGDMYARFIKGYTGT